jgi:hypothetical protein
MMHDPSSSVHATVSRKLPLFFERLVVSRCDVRSGSFCSVVASSDILKRERDVKRDMEE